MTDATKSSSPAAARPGFSSRWILDGARPGTGAPANSVDRDPRPIDTDGDGIADTLALRVDAVAPQPSALRRLGTWMGRSLVTIVFVAALVAAAAAATSLWHTRDDLSAARSELTQVERQLATVTAERDAATADVADLSGEAATATTERDAAAKEQAALELEVQVLRGMLVDAQPATTKD